MKRDWLVELPYAKFMFARIHVDQLAAELHSFELETIALLGFGGCFQFDRAASTYHAMPRQRINRVATQEPRNGAMIERIAGGGRNPAIRTHFSHGDRNDHSTKSIIAYVIWLQAVADDSTLKLLFVEKPEAISRNLKALLHLTHGNLSELHSCLVEGTIDFDRLSRSWASRLS